VGRNAKYPLSQPRAGLYTAGTASRNTGNPGSNFINFFPFHLVFNCAFFPLRIRVGFFRRCKYSVNVHGSCTEPRKLLEQVYDCCTVDDQKYRHQVKFQFPGLVPEEEHSAVGTKGTEGSSQQQQVLRRSPCIAFCFPLIICKEKKRNNVENCVEGQKKNRDGKGSHPCRFVRGGYCFFVVNRWISAAGLSGDLCRKGIDTKKRDFSRTKKITIIAAQNTLPA
jgi:hypothetical protein